MRRLFFFAIALLLPLTACGDDSTGPGNANAHVGTYTFISLNGQNLPTFVEEDGVRVTFLSGRLTLNTDGTASQSFTAQVAQGTSVQQETFRYAGTYSRSGDAIVITWAQSEQETYSFSGGNTLTLSESGFVAVFRK